MAEYEKTPPPGGTRIVSAVFQKAEEAEKAYAAAIDLGYSDRDITVLMSQQARDRYYPGERVEIERGTRALEGTGVGSAVGATVGALAGAIVALGTVVAVPPLGLVVAGPLAVGLAGAGAGSITGGVIGALIGAGISEDRARVYHTALEKGGIVLAVAPHTREDADALAEAFDDAGGEDVYRA